MTKTPRSSSTTRRCFLIQGAAALAGLAVPGVVRAVPRSTRSLAFLSMHTGEELEVTYWAGGSYVEPALERINRILRDHRTGEMIDTDLGLLDLLYAVRSELGTDEVLHVISGYRSPKTNAWLRRMGHRVAKRSLHMAGKAADIVIPGVPLSELRDVGLGLHRGGVGYYEKEFVHLDVGRVRSW